MWPPGGLVVVVVVVGCNHGRGGGSEQKIKTDLGWELLETDRTGQPPDGEFGWQPQQLFCDYTGR